MLIELLKSLFDNSIAYQIIQSFIRLFTDLLNIRMVIWLLEWLLDHTYWIIRKLPDQRLIDLMKGLFDYSKIL